MKQYINEPKAKMMPKELVAHNDIRIDNYYWLNNNNNDDVIAYLVAENAYYQQMTAHTSEVQQKLFEEMKSRIKEDDSSVPYFYNGYCYITRYELGKDYPIYSRKNGHLEAEEEIM